MKRILILKIISWIGVISPLLWLIINLFHGELSADPAKDIQHFTGQVALKVLFATLIISPLVYFFKWSSLNRVKRLLGVSSFFWASAHVASYIVFELGGDMALFINEIMDRSYLQVAAVAWIGLLILALTSFKKAVKILKKHWKRIHNTVYFIAALIIIHYYLSLKLKQITPLIYGSVLILLWGCQLYRKLKKNRQ